MKFNFKAFALCEMTVYDDDDILAELCGVYLSEEDARLESECITKGKEVAHEKYERTYRWSRRPFVAPLFQIVELDNMEFKWFSDAEEMIQAAAILQQRGCGKAVSQ